MRFAKLLGAHLKSDEVIAILERFEIDVTYDFDRLHEGSEDRYWAGSKERGFLFRFDQAQVLDTIFLYMRPREGYAAIDRAEVDVPIYDSFEEAEAAAAQSGTPFVHSATIPGNRERWWIRLNMGNWTIHYQYNKEGHLRGITLSVQVVHDAA